MICALKITQLCLVETITLIISTYIINDYLFDPCSVPVAVTCLKSGNFIGQENYTCTSDWTGGIARWYTISYLTRFADSSYCFRSLKYHMLLAIKVTTHAEPMFTSFMYRFPANNPFRCFCLFFLEALHRREDFNCQVILLETCSDFVAFAYR